MNRSWFRLPFGGGNSSHQQQDGEDDDGIDSAAIHDSGELLPGGSRADRGNNSGSNGRRSKTSSSYERTAFKQTISRPFPSPLATGSDTASYATAQASSALSESSVASTSYGNNRRTEAQYVETTSSNESHITGSGTTQHNYNASLHSISSIRTAHFINKSSAEAFERLQRSTTPEGSMEVSPSKTPLRDRLNRLSIASTASGMVNFDDGDREEAERRWLEDDPDEVAEGLGLAQVREEDEGHNDASGSDFEESDNDDAEEDRDRPFRPQMTPSRSSTSLKSILKKSQASSIEAIIAPATPASQLIIQATPRTVTWSPSTRPAAQSPPHVDASPEHPRGPLAAAEAYLLNLGQRQQHEYYQGPDSPYKRGYIRNQEDEDDEEGGDFVSSDESASEIEEALLSRSSNGISPPLSMAPSPNVSSTGSVVHNNNDDESTDSLRLKGSTSKRGAAFLSQMNGLIPSPESSFAETKHASDETHQGNHNTAKHVDMSVSNILDMSAPSHSVSHDVTMNDGHSQITRQGGPRPFLLRQSVIMEESSSSIMPDASLHSPTRTEATSTSPVNSPDKSLAASTARGGLSFVTAPQVSPLVAVHTPMKQIAPRKKASLRQDVAKATSTSHDDRSTHTMTRTVDLEEEDSSRLENFVTPSEAVEASQAAIVISEEHDDRSDEEELPADSSPTPSLLPLPSITPSSSSSSIIKLKPESPFTSLVNHLLSTQDELLSHRADQKTMLISLVSNLRGELASRDRMLDVLEAQKKSLERSLRREKEERENDRKNTKQRVNSAMNQVEEIREQLSVEVKRRDDAMREELLHEKAKRELAEKQVESLRRNNTSSEEIEFLRVQLQDMREAADEQKLANEQANHDLEQTRLLLDDARKEHQHAEQRIEASQRAQEDARAEADMLSEECVKLRKQFSAAEQQVSKISIDFEHQVNSLHSKLVQADSKVSKLTGQLDDVTHALQHERSEQARQYDMSASLQHSLRIDNDELASSVARLERAKEHSFQQLQIIKKDTATVLAQKEEKIAQLQDEIMKRSLDRRTNTADVACSSCKDSNERTGFLEKEIVRLRELVGKMRMESADREVKVARLVKTREQLKEDIEGLNIALEAKQMELQMLKRESHHRLSADGTSIMASTKSHSRILKGRPSSIHDSTAGAPEVTASSKFATDQRRRSLRSRPAQGTASRSSVQRSSIDAPNILASIKHSNNGENQFLLGAARRNGSRDLSNAQETALAAASLVKVLSSAEQVGEDKENARIVNRHATLQALHDLPKVPTQKLGVLQSSMLLE